MRLMGQSAAEFITSNVVALAIILVLIVLLLYLGAANMNLSRSACFFHGSFACSSYSLSASRGLSLNISQTTGGTVIVSAVSCSASGSTEFQPLESQITIPFGTVKQISGGSTRNLILCNGTSPEAGSIYSGKLCLLYHTFEASTNRTVCGELVSQVT